MPKPPFTQYHDAHGLVHHLMPILYGTSQTGARAWITLAIDDILGGNETLETLQDLVLEREYTFGVPSFLHSGWFLEGLRTYS